MKQPTDLDKAILMLAFHHLEDHDELGAAAKTVLKSYHYVVVEEAHAALGS